MGKAVCYGGILLFLFVRATGARSETLEQSRTSLNLRQDLIPPGKFGRLPGRPLPAVRFVTIHSTEVTQPFANAAHFARRLRTGEEKSADPRSRTGYKTWHFTVDSTSVVQHLPSHEQGDHADFSGPGNRSSIGIEMCENQGADVHATRDRAARLIAYLCASENIPETNLRMHWHWGQAPSKGTTPPYHKRCPHSFLDQTSGGTFSPNKNWEDFRSQVHLYLSKLTTDRVH